MSIRIQSEGSSASASHCEARTGGKAEAESSPARITHALELDALLLAIKVVDAVSIFVVWVILAVMHRERSITSSLSRRRRSRRGGLRVEYRNKLSGCRSRRKDELLLDDLWAAKKGVSCWLTLAQSHPARQD